MNLDNMTQREIKELCDSFEGRVQELGEIRATLIVNCKEGRALHKLGIEYDDKKTALRNLVYILDRLISKCTCTAAEAAGGDA